MRRLALLVGACLVWASVASGQSGTAVTIHSSSGTESATSGNPLRVDPTGTTTQPVSVADVTVTGNLAANANSTAIALAGEQGVAVVLATDTFSGATVITPQVSLDGGATYIAVAFANAQTGAISATLSLNATTGASYFLVYPGNPTNARLSANASGATGNVAYTLKATANRAFVFNYGSDGTQARQMAVTTGGLTKVDLSGTGANVTALGVTGSGTAGSPSAGVVTVQGISSMTKLLVTPDANSAVNVAQVSGTTADTNSGTKSAGTLRVVLATDQPQLTNKLLVTPDSVALPANQSVNVNQLAGTTTDTNSGVKSAGTLRVVLATDQPQLTNKLLVTPDSVALPANQSVNVSQLAGTTTDTNSGNKSAGTLRVVLATDQPALTNAQPVNVAQVGATAVVASPCETAIPTTVAISFASSTVQKVITKAASKKNYICSIVIVAGAAEILNILEGTQTTNQCDTSTTAVVGSTTAANGMSFAANGGFSAIGGKGVAIPGIGTNVDTCLATNGSNRIAGFLSYVQQ